MTRSARGPIPADAVHLAGETYYLPGVTNGGLVSGVAIDTTAEESAYAGSVVELLAITHGHADHFGCAAALRSAGATVYAARDDATLVENPEVNIRGMFSWAKPSDQLVTKLFRGEGCPVDAYLEDWDDPRASAVHLPGHTLGHTGFVTPDRVLFSGDALYLIELWERHRLPYSIDPEMVVDSLERIRGLDFDLLVPAHGRPVDRDEAEAHIDHHIAEIRGIEAFLVDSLREAQTTEGAIALVSAERGLSENAAGYWLAVTTVKGYLGNLLGRGEVEFFVRDHAGWWRTI